MLHLMDMTPVFNNAQKKQEDELFRDWIGFMINLIHYLFNEQIIINSL